MHKFITVSGHGRQLRLSPFVYFKFIPVVFVAPFTIVRRWKNIHMEIVFWLIFFLLHNLLQHAARLYSHLFHLLQLLYTIIWIALNILVAQRFRSTENCIHSAHSQTHMCLTVWINLLLSLDQTITVCYPNIVSQHENPLKPLITKLVSKLKCHTDSHCNKSYSHISRSARKR